MKNIAEIRFNESVLAGETTALGNVFTMTCLNLKHIEEKYDNIRKQYGNGRSAPCQTPHCIQMFNILFKNLKIGMKIHI